MKFTDDDLKRFKERNAKPRYAMQLRQEQWEALLARLEAAEALLNLWMQCDDDCEIDGSVFDAAMKAWHESKGE